MGIAIMRKKSSQKVRSWKKWLPSSDRPISNNFMKRRTVQQALKTGNVIFEMEGKYLRVPLSQKLALKGSCAKLHESMAARYQKYAKARTVGEALKMGALAEDLVYTSKKGLLKFLPSLKGKLVEEPLPIKDWPPGIRAADGHAPWWLPMNWAHGVKTTCKTYLPVFIAPNGRTCFHQDVVEAIVHETLSGKLRMVEWGRAQVLAGRDWNGGGINFDSEAKMFSNLSKKEQSCLPRKTELHFCVISARRASELSGIRGIVNVQARLTAAGIRPRWFVDEASLKDYRALGLDAVVGGKLTPARNKALKEAARLKKACVQVSDDITGWTYCNSKLDVAALRRMGPKKMLQVANKAAYGEGRSTMDVSPLAAARFILAKMRAADPRCHLGGVQPTGNPAMAILTMPTTLDGFILGDFCVHDNSPCRFDETITLKEDYDFSCSHLARHGCVMRCNHLVLKVIHETNPGGAVSVRDARGQKERANIRILMRKWPGVFKLHSRRGDTQVKMKWSHRTKRKSHSR